MNKLVSIILPVRNESGSIMETINSILKQDYLNHGQIEIIVADGMSTDNTLEIIKEKVKGTSLNVIIVENVKKIVPTGFNMALSISNGDYIVRVDGHTTLSESYVSNCVKHLENREIWNVGGLMSSIGQNNISKLISIATASRFGIGNSDFHYSLKSKWATSVYLGAWRKKVFKLLGGFDEELVRNQDDEFNLRTIMKGGKIWLDPLIESKYFPRTGFLKLFKQYFQYGFYKIRVLQKRLGFSSYRQFVPSIFVLGLFLSFLSIIVNQNYFVFKLVCIPYVILSLTYSLFLSLGYGHRKTYENNKLDLKILSIITLPVVFFTIHISYGIGFLSGFLFFINKWNDTRIINDHLDF